MSQRFLRRMNAEGSVSRTKRKLLKREVILTQHVSKSLRTSRIRARNLIGWHALKVRELSSSNTFNIYAGKDDNGMAAGLGDNKHAVGKDFLSERGIDMEGLLRF